MYYVYYEYIKTGRTEFVRAFDSHEDAINHISKCYNIDKQCCQLGEYYYYMTKR